jgi:hypothetical protein
VSYPGWQSYRNLWARGSASERRVVYLPRTTDYGTIAALTSSFWPVVGKEDVNGGKKAGDDSPKR